MGGLTAHRGWKRRRVMDKKCRVIDHLPEQDSLFSASDYDGPKAPSVEEKVATLVYRRDRLIKGLQRLLRDAERTEV